MTYFLLHCSCTPGGTSLSWSCNLAGHSVVKVPGHRDSYIGNTNGLNKTIGAVLRGLQPLIKTLPAPPLNGFGFQCVTIPPFKCDLAESTAEHDSTWESEPTKKTGDKIAHMFAQFLAGRAGGLQHDHLYKVLSEGLPLAMYKTTRKVGAVLVIVPSSCLTCFAYLFLFSWSRRSLLSMPVSSCSSAPCFALT